jgi:hypothetical protein
MRERLALLWCRALNHPLWLKADGTIWCYGHGGVRGHWER